MSQIKQKFLAVGAVGKLFNNTFFKARNAADNGDINILKVNSDDSIQLALWKLPATDGAANYHLKTDGSGNLDWAAAGGTGTVTSVATGTGLTGGPVTSSGTISLADTAVTPGSYTYSSITVDAQGRITAASSGSAPPALPTWNKENLTLVSGDITAQYIDLAQQALANSLDVFVDGVMQVEGSDYTLSVVSSKTRITFAGDLASLLSAGDILHCKYQY